MGDRRRKEEQKAAAAAQPKDTGRRTTSFVNGAGIDREVITTDICRYLGNDALVKPGTYNDKNGGAIDGYYITAYRPLTSEQLRDIKNDSAKWQEEKRRNRVPTGGYDSSDTRSRIWGEETRQSPQAPYPPQPQTNFGNPIPQPNPPMGRGYDQYQPQNPMGQPNTYSQPRSSPFNNPSEPSYTTFSQPLTQQPLATTNFLATDSRSQQLPRMDEPRSMNPPYSGQQQSHPMQQPYPSAVGRGGPQYYSSGMPPNVPPVYQQPPDYQYGRAPGPEPAPYDMRDYSEQDEDMEFETAATSAPPTSASTSQSRPSESSRKRTHDSDRHRRH